MNAIVTAGGVPQPQDSLYEYTRGRPKALLDVAGKPMVQWVIDALDNAEKIENIIVVGLPLNSGLASKKHLYYLSDQGNMLSNIVAGVNQVLDLNPKAEYVLIVSSDIPALRSEQVDWLIETCMQTREDIYYGVCPRDVMEMRFPNSHRTYTNLKDMQVCGADINIAHVRMATEHLDMWEELIGNRKNPMKQAATIGFGTLFMLATGNLTLADAVDRITKSIGITGRSIVWEHAEPCMDVDKPQQLELLREDLEKQLISAVSGLIRSESEIEVVPKNLYPQGVEEIQTKAETNKIITQLTKDNGNKHERSIKVFLCYASEDRTSVKTLYKRLITDGIDAWMDTEKLLPGQDWQAEIGKAVASSDAFVTCISSKSVTKEGYVQKEIRFALEIADEKPEGSVYIIPVRLEECLVPSRLNRWHWVDLFERRGYKKLLQSLKLRADTIGLSFGLSVEDV